ncbi:MAG: hypothetical protein IIY32_09385, partial [Thermoguttaceae bacterium]|nr:hypothetical protein [Thermoguttaceae bacterium]
KSPYYAVGSTLSASLSSDVAEATYSWRASNDGEEWFTIEDATSATLAIDAVLAEYRQIKVVATGTGVSKGSSSEVVASPGVVAFDYVPETRSATLAWSAVDSALRYDALLSLDGGATWNDPITSVDEPTCVVGELDAGQSYFFVVYAHDADELRIGGFSGTFAPVSVVANVDDYRVGDSVSVTVTASDDASYEIAWFYATDDGDVAIEEAAGLLEYVPASADYPIKVVVTGPGNSSGSVSETTVPVHTNLLGAGVFAPYDTLERSVALTWNVVDGATCYRFMEGTPNDDDSIAWQNVATITLEDGVVTSGAATLSDDLMELTYTIGSLNAGCNGYYKVVAFDALDTALEEQEFAYASFGLVLDHDAYSLEGDALVASTTPETNVSYQWSRSDDCGETWTALENANDPTWSIPSEDAADGRWLKLVATNDATGAQAVVYARPESLRAPVDVVYAVDSDANAFTFSFPAVDDATGYQIEYYLSSAEYPVWINLTNVTYTTDDDGIVTASHVNASSYADYQFRVRSVNDSGWSEWNAVEVHAPEELAIASYDPETSSLTLTWRDQNNETGYALSGIVVDPDGNATEIATIEIDANETRYVFEGVLPGYAYEFVLTATGGSADAFSEIS